MNDNRENSEFIELLTPNYYKIHGFILSLVPNKADAEDVLQSAITYMWEHFGDFKLGTNFVAWAITISKYHVLTYHKKQQRSRIHFSDKAIELIELENQKLQNELDERSDALDSCMRKLSHKDLTLMIKRFDKGMSVKNLASEIGMSVNVAYKQFSRIKMLLLNCVRKVLAGEASYE